MLLLCHSDIKYGACMSGALGMKLRLSIHKLMLLPLLKKSTALQGVLPHQAEPMVDRPVTGWVLAMGVLVAARLGRSAAEAQQFDLSHLQVSLPWQGGRALLACSHGLETLQKSH